MKRTFISLFSGIGGLDLGLERAGMECIAQVENNEWCQKILAKHWPDVIRHSDVRGVGKHNLPYADVLCGGFPCQDISVAGGGAGLSGQRSGLWFEYLRIVRELRPRYVIVENVAALVNRGLDVVLGGLAESGYDAEWQVLPAAAFGAIHLRERLFIIAYARGERRQGGGPQTLFGQSPLQGRENQRRATDMRNRSHLFTPRLCRSLNGLPAGMDRLKGLGNAVVPQVAEYVGACVVAHAERMEAAA